MKPDTKVSATRKRKKPAFHIHSYMACDLEKDVDFKLKLGPAEITIPVMVSVWRCPYCMYDAKEVRVVAR